MKRKDRTKQIAQWAAEMGEVDFDYLMSLLVEETEPQSRDSATDRLIDRFLEVKDLRIEVEQSPAESGGGVPLPVMAFEPSPELQSLSKESEQLARIYHSQGMFKEAKEIYNQLFLLYSEKITYFASQIESLSLEERSRESEVADS